MKKQPFAFTIFGHRLMPARSALIGEISVMGRPCRRTTSIGMHNAEQHVEQLALAHALQRRYPNDFASPYGNGEVGHLRADAKALCFKSRYANSAGLYFCARWIDGTDGATDHKAHNFVVAHIIEWI